MAKSSKSRPKPVLQPRIRVRLGNDIAIGPGKADLLEQVRISGSISRAALAMGLSYMRAWSLIKIMNRCFKEPLVESVRGGTSGGGARLTPTGEEVLSLYREIEAASLAAGQSPWRKLQALVRV